MKGFSQGRAKTGTSNTDMGKGESYLIAPSYVKVPTVEIAYLMLDALKAVAKAETLIIAASLNETQICLNPPRDEFFAAFFAGTRIIFSNSTGKT